MHTAGRGRNQAVIWEKRCTLNCLGHVLHLVNVAKETGGAGARAGLGAFILCETDENRKKAGAREA